MRKTSLFLSLIFIILLLIIYNLPYKNYNYEHLPNLKENTKVIIKGNIIDTKEFGKNYLLILDNNIKIISNIPVYAKTIEVNGKITKYNKEIFVKADKITSLN